MPSIASTKKEIITASTGLPHSASGHNSSGRQWM
jgi:hypothetical protein